MKLSLIHLFSITLLLTSCYSSHKAVQTKQRSTQETPFFADINNDGNYQLIELENENRPEPAQGKKQFWTDFFKTLKYPETARKNGVSGIVVLGIEVDQYGKVKTAEVIRKVSKEIDALTLKAYVNASKKGYFPLLINNVATSFRMELPIKYSL